ncbi:MAG: caspase family protein [Syntrophobacteraceae bacterium]|jgi:hypothetical protein
MKRSLFFVIAGIMIFSFQGKADAQLSGKFNNSYALVVGIDNYPHSNWLSLEYPVRDAQRVSEYLRTQGFQVETLTDEQATRQNILSYFDKLSQKVTDNDRLLFYFGGHGTTENIGGTQFGYLVPFGAGRSSADMISTDDLKSQSQRLGKARHQLFIVNACYGGLLGVLRGGGIDSSQNNYIKVVTELPAREFISAGGPNQRVLDGGPDGLSWFTYYLLEALEQGKADLNQDNVITFAELAAYLVPRASNEYQTPAWGCLYGHGLGEFVFDKTASSPKGSGTVPMVPSNLARANVTRGKESINVNELRKPVDNLFLAWEKLDLAMYLRQWSPDAVQYLPKTSRDFKSIREKRTKDFQKYSKVEVLGYQVHYVGSVGDTAELGVSYYMNFYGKNGAVIKEHGILESYKVKYSKEADQWQIVENRDYIGKKGD